MKKIGFKESRLSLNNYFLWRKERAIPAVEKVNEILSLKNRQILEIGCGYGALCEVLNEFGAKVNAVEIDKEKVKFAINRFEKNKNIQIKLVKDEKLPYKNNSFDCVFLFDVIEHISNPNKTINECFRVLKNKGILYAEFTPYYSVTGHHLYDFAKWPIHIFPKSFIKNFVYSKKIRGFLTHEYFWDLFESLNKLKISQFQKMVYKFKCLDERYIIKYPELLEFNIPFLRYLGPFKDYATMSFEGIYQK
ncbi:hypothetical protein A3D78_01090 [Candidatus Gottesmanbacteria bacterium RIFCSPHIGHO2_02_FULL_39_14]|uniref:Methyltransferase type 11 domain-containing protein n=1 Tax=Candidatus Gottesmanbacteria bacterium RIFCSPHIGHO2_02_FULL_39_14 TaxID=1798383 RepID=A0A1F6A0C8_9BACT|nr:MAG: hypothetical protein A3D78_01090 [Candidatus Gottesmanbacteria bacterium RIFCSPHIGHO2_02_FULL_39_14]